MQASSRLVCSEENNNCSEVDLTKEGVLGEEGQATAVGLRPIYELSLHGK